MAFPTALSLSQSLRQSRSHLSSYFPPSIRSLIPPSLIPRQSYSTTSSSRLRHSRVLVFRDGKWTYLPRTRLALDRYSSPVGPVLLNESTSREDGQDVPNPGVPASSSPSPAQDVDLKATTKAEQPSSSSSPTTNASPHAKLEPAVRSSAQPKSLPSEESKLTMSPEKIVEVKLEGDKKGKGVKVSIPPKPRPPEYDECCMSGCAICVYDLYASDLTDFESSLLSSRQLLQTNQIPKRSWPTELLTPNERTAISQEQGKGSTDPEKKKRGRPKKKTNADATPILSDISAGIGDEDGIPSGVGDEGGGLLEGLVDNPIIQQFVRFEKQKKKEKELEAEMERKKSTPARGGGPVSSAASRNQQEAQVGGPS